MSEKSADIDIRIAEKYPKWAELRRKRAAEKLEAKNGLRLRGLAVLTDMLAESRNCYLAAVQYPRPIRNPCAEIVLSFFQPCNLDVGATIRTVGPTGKVSTFWVTEIMSALEFRVASMAPNEVLRTFGYFPTQPKKTYKQFTLEEVGYAKPQDRAKKVKPPKKPKPPFQPGWPAPKRFVSQTQQSRRR